VVLYAEIEFWNLTMHKLDLSKNPRLRFALLVLYYFAIIVALLILYGRSAFSTPPFVYQGF
jgi:hypothetical protein